MKKEKRKNKILRGGRKGKGLGKKDKEAGKHISPILYFARTGLTETCIGFNLGAPEDRHKGEKIHYKGGEERQNIFDKELD